MTIEFIQHHTPYAKGDIAGVPDEEAKQLIEQEIARPYKQAHPDPEPETKDAPAPENKMVGKAPVKK